MTRGSLCVLLATLALAQARLDGLSAGLAGEPVVADVFSQIDDYFRNALWSSLRSEELLFPSLNEAQLKFAVNPSYPQYSAPVFGDPSAAQNDDKDDGSENDEVVEDPFIVANNPPYVPPKKASLKALLNEDPRVLAKAIDDERINDIYFTTIVGVTSGLTVFVIVGVGFLFHRARKNAKAAEDVEYPAYGVTGPGKDSPTSGDRKLAQNAQLYHYQHQKQQMIAFDSHADSQRRSMSDNESEDGEDGDYTVYECPGLAPTGEMEVRNPMFEDDVTPKANNK